MIKNYRFKTQPYSHQLEALERSWDKKTYALFMEMGTGKSKVLVDNIAMLYDRGLIRGAAIVAPKGVYKNWDEIELPVHMPEHVEYTKVLWEPNLTKKKKAELDTLFETAASLHGFAAADSDLARFVTDRLVVRLRDSGLAHDTVAASVRDGDISQIDAQVKKARALDEVLNTDTGAALIAGFRRAANILAAEEKKSGETLSDIVAEALLDAAEEKALFASVMALSKLSANSEADISNAMRGLADLRAPIDAFFDKVIVNADDADLRTNRLALLMRVRSAMMQIADFSKIEKS